MARPEKVAVVDEIKEKLEGARAVFITEYRGLSVGQQQALRRSLRKADAEYKVFKMTLARRAAEEAGMTDLLVWLEGPTAIAFTSGDPVPAAKSLKDFASDNDRLVLKGGLLAGATLDAEGVRRLADVEPREVLLAKLAGAMKAPLSNLAGLMTAVLRQPVTAMQQLLEKREADPAFAAVDASAEPAAEEPTSGETASAESAVEEPAAEAADAEQAEAEEPSEEQAAVEAAAEVATEEETAPAGSASEEAVEKSAEEPAAADSEAAAADADPDSEDSDK